MAVIRRTNLIAAAFSIVGVCSIALAQPSALNIRDLGARGDGVTDDTHAFQEAARGVPNPDFEAQLPFTIEREEAAGDSIANPTVSGPASVSREDDGAPTFLVYTAGAPYYIFEITSDPGPFRTDQGRDASNFYGSYDDPSVMSRLTAATFTLPDAAWDALKDSDSLYFRIGTTTSSTGWNNYATSTSDGSAELAPSMEITDARVTRPPRPDKLVKCLGRRSAHPPGPRTSSERTSRIALR